MPKTKDGWTDGFSALYSRRLLVRYIRLVRFICTSFYAAAIA